MTGLGATILLLLATQPACAGRKGLEPTPAWQTREGRDQVRIELAESLLDAGATPQALQLLADLRAEGHKDPQLDYLQGRALYETGLYDEARTLLESATKRLHGDPRPWRTLGLLHADLRQTEEAIVALQRASELDEAHAPTWNNLGYLLLSVRRYEEAAPALQRAVSLDASNARYRNNLGFAQVALGRDTEGLRAFRSAGPEENAQANFALAKELAGDPETARRHYDQALAINPNHVQARAGLERLAPPKESP